MTTRAFDAAVIGGGVVGCAVLRCLALAGYSAVLLERGADILSGASKANSAILHTGFDAPPGSREVAMMQAGRRTYLAARESFGLPILETHAVLVAWSEAEQARLPEILAKAHKNGVNGVRPLTLEELRQMVPQISGQAQAALLVPGEHIIDPWSSPLAYALQALLHGAEIFRGAEVTAVERRGQGWVLRTARQVVQAGVVINCAGNFGDRVEALGGRQRFRIRPRKGQFVVFDKSALRHVPSIILPVPTARTKGLVVCPTIFGNVLAGPTAEDQDDREQATVERATLDMLLGEAGRIIPALASEPVAASYAGLRPASDREDYILEAHPTERWITAGGIRSTGLTAALGIGEHVVNLMQEHFKAAKPVNEIRWPRLPNLAEHRPRDHARPGRGRLVCLCELVTEDEIAAALAGPLPAGDLGGLKRRTRALMGRCQGFNCLADVCQLAHGKLQEPLPIAELRHDT